MLIIIGVNKFIRDFYIGRKWNGFTKVFFNREIRLYINKLLKSIVGSYRILIFYETLKKVNTS